METRTEMIRFRVTPSEKTKIQALKLNGEDESVAARRVLLEQVKEYKDPADKKIMLWNLEIREIDEELDRLHARREVLVGLVENTLRKKGGK